MSGLAKLSREGDWSFLDNKEVVSVARAVAGVVARKYQKYRIEPDDLTQEAFVILATKLADRVRREGAKGLNLPLYRDLQDLIEAQIKRLDGQVFYGLNPEKLGDLRRTKGAPAVLAVARAVRDDGEDEEWS